MAFTHQVAAKVHVVGVALAAPAEKVRGAGADAAHVGAVAVALHRVLDVALKKILNSNVIIFCFAKKCPVSSFVGTSFKGSNGRWVVIAGV